MKRKNYSKGKFHMCRVVINGVKRTTTGGDCCDWLINDLGNSYGIIKPKRVRWMSKSDYINAFDNNFTRFCENFNPNGQNTISYIFIAKHGARYLRSVEQIIIATMNVDGSRKIYEIYPQKNVFDLRDPEDYDRYHNGLNKIGMDSMKFTFSGGYENLFNIAAIFYPSNGPGLNLV